ncbi:MAG: helix-turn-helix domain-containing protein, partial [Deltaproteobacteria bacterium]|nr:helix-turn-helix domain-containing protein [Deltaproteobacteria bacterium]
MKKKEGNSGYRPFVPAVEQASRVLICLGRSPKFKMTLTEICNQVGIHKSKGYSILNTLKQFGLVEKDPQTKTYSLGVGLVFLARNVLDNLDLRDIVEPYLESLANETFSTALFGLISAEQVFIIAKHEVDHNVGVTIRLGHRFHITSGAHGKAIVAFMPDEKREKILKRDKLYFYGDASAMDTKRLRKELLECRRSGFAQDKGGLQPGINAVSAPVLAFMPEFAYSNVTREMETYGYDSVVKSHCRMCHGGCGVLVYVKGGKVTKITGDPDCPINHGTLCSKGIASHQLAYHPDRL